MADIVDQNFKTAILKMLQELKEDIEKVKKMICEQNGNINKEIDMPSGAMRREQGRSHWSW